MKRKIIALLGTLAIVLAVILAVFFIGNKKTEDSVDIWEEIGVEPYDENLKVISGEEYFTYQDGILSFDMSKEPSEPYCLIVPAKYYKQDVRSVSEISGSDYLTDIVYLSPRESICGCRKCYSLKRIVYVAIGQESYVADEEDYNSYGINNYWVDAGNDIPNVEQIVFSGDSGYFRMEDIINMQRLKEIKLPDKITYLKVACSYVSIKELTLPEETLRLFFSVNQNDELRYVVCNKKLETIEQCFNGCKNLEYVVVHEKVKSIDDSSFHECPKLKLVVKKDSYAEKYAMEKGIEYVYEEDFDFAQYKKSIGDE